MAFNAVTQILADFPWLQELGDNVFNVILEETLDNSPPEVIIQAVRNTQDYKERFAGLQQRKQRGFTPITEAEYLAVEDAYRSQLREFGILGTLNLTNNAEFRDFASELIGGDVSVAEFNRRLDTGISLVNESSEFVQSAFRDFYGVEVSPDALLTYFLDPDIGTNIIEEQLAAATVGAEAFRFGLNISRTRAEILRKEGITKEFARTGFADVARETPLLRRLAAVHNFTPLEQEDLEQFFFHEDPQVAQERGRLFQTALNEFRPAASQRSREGGVSELVDFRRTV